MKIWNTSSVFGLLMFAIFTQSTFETTVYGQNNELGKTLPKNRPNIVLIMADDLGFSDLGCYGSEIETPNLDALAAGGLKMTQFYNCAKCTTTRAALVTGRFPRISSNLLRKNDLSIGELMKSAGYQTSLSGKWHLGHNKTTHPFHRGFDRFYGLLDGCCNFFDPSIRDPKYKGSRIRVFGKDDQRITSFPENFYSTTAFTDHALDSIEKFCTDPAKPFFVHLTYTAPHYPLHAPEEVIKKYLGKYSSGWDKLRSDRFERQKKLGLLPRSTKISGTDSRAYSWDKANQEYEDRRMATYAAMIDVMDQQIGRIVLMLKERKIFDNTLIIFISDNGGCAEEPGGRNPKRIPGPKEFYTAVGPAWGWAQNTPFRRYKSWINEGGISTPMIAHCPTIIPSGSKSDQVAHVIDLAPTFADLAGISWPKVYDQKSVHPTQGSSIKHILEGKRTSPDRTLFWYWAGNKAIRVSDWKLVYDKIEKKWSLFDLSVDRTELNDLSEKYPQRTKQMLQQWQEWYQQNEDKKSKKNLK